MGGTKNSKCKGPKVRILGMCEEKQVDQTVQMIIAQGGRP